jgi:purine-cytosine permease-like protein
MVWLFGGTYLERAFEHWLWPALGFLFLPLTTLAFAYGTNSLAQGGAMTPLGWLLVALAVVVDLGLWGGGGRDAYRYRRRSR